MSYGPNRLEIFRRAATYVDKILNDSSGDAQQPADLPAERPTKFELAINLKPAKQFELTILRMRWRGRIR